MDEFYLSLHQMGLRAKGGISGMAGRLGVRGQVLINKLNPHDANSEPKVGEFVAMMHDTSNTTPLDVLCRMFGGQFSTRSQRKGASVLGALIRAINEHSDIAKVYEQSFADGVLTGKEKYALLQEINEARDALIELENSLMAHEVGEP